MKKTGIAIILIFLSFGLCFAENAGTGSGEPGTQEKVDQLKKAIAEAPDNAKKAALHKELGEFYASKQEYGNAAEEYLRALSLFPGFPENERFRMAVQISWGGRLDEAARILRQILRDNPNNVEAGVHLARILRWSGKTREAYDEIEKVLKTHPENRDAIQVKAAILNSMGRPKESILLSKRLLEVHEDFDTRIGLSYALLSVRKVREAERSAEKLKPEYPYQEKELGKFTEELNRLVRPRYSLQYSYYEDSDDNALNRYGFSVGKLIADYDFTIGYLLTSARDRTRHNRAHDILAEIYLPVSESLGIGLGGGASIMDAATHETSFVGYARVDGKIPGGFLGFTARRFAVTDTAELIENHITAVRLGVFGSKMLAPRVSLYGAYNYTDFSDNNHSNDVLIRPGFILRKGNPGIVLDYTARYVTFRRQSRSGYYDPSYIVANQLSVHFSYEKDKFSMNLSPYGGYQVSERYGNHDDDFYGGGIGSVGYRITNALTVELFGEGGNYALSTTGGWNYYFAGVRLKGHF